MRPSPRALSRPLRIVLLSLVIGAFALAAPSLADMRLARADDPPVAVGVTLIARTDVEIQKVVIARSTKLEVTGASATTIDVALPDGYVLRKIPRNRIPHFFDVVR